MFFKDVVGQEEAKKMLIREALSEKIAHAKLICGGEGIGKLPLAIAYARYISCENPKGDDACGICPNCIKYNKLAHPDLHFIFPVIKKKNNKDKGQRQFCGCIVSKDIGQYNTCPHLCEYCYANSSKEVATNNYKRHLASPLSETITGI